MNKHTEMKRLYFSLICFVFIFKFGNGQTTIEDLSFFNKNLNTIVQNPEQTNKVATYFLKSDISESHTGAAHYLLFEYEKLQGNNISGIEHLFNAKSNAAKAPDQYLYVLALISIAEICHHYGMETMATNYLDEAASKFIIIPEGINRDIAAIRFIHAQAKFKSSESIAPEALAHIEKSQVHLVEIKNEFPALYANGLNKIAELYLENNEVALAKNQFTAAFQFLKENKLQSTSVAAATLSGLAAIELRQPDYQSAGQLYNNALASDVIAPQVKLKILEGLAATYKVQDSLEAYNTYYTQSSQQSSAILKDERNLRNTLLSLIEEDQNQITIANREKYYIIGGLILAALLVLLTIYYFYNKQLDKEYLKFEKIIQQIEKKEKIEAPLQAEKSEAQASKGLVIPIATEQSILERLDDFEKGNDFTNQNMTLPFLAKKLKTNTKYISEIIHTHKNKNFNTYINELRINYIIHLMKEDPKYLNYKVSYLAEVSGFSSHSSFTVVFKSIAGITPKQFVSFLKKSNKEAS